MVDGDSYRVVPEFRYLGVYIDRAGRPSTVAAHQLQAAKGSFARLCTYLGTQGWTLIWTRLVLYEVYVRTHLTFGAPTWAAAYLRRGEISSDRGPLGLLSITYRQGLRTMTGLDGYTRGAVLYIVTLRWPVEVALAKAVYRYYKGITEDMSR